MSDHDATIRAANLEGGTPMAPIEAPLTYATLDAAELAQDEALTEMGNAQSLLAIATGARERTALRHIYREQAKKFRRAYVEARRLRREAQGGQQR